VPLLSVPLTASRRSASRPIRLAADPVRGGAGLRRRWAAMMYSLMVYRLEQPLSRYRWQAAL